MDHLRPVPSGDPAPEQGSSDGAALAALLQRASRGDEQAFGRLYDATSARAYGLALRVVRNPALAEEVVQDAYLDAWRTSGRFDAARERDGLVADDRAPQGGRPGPLRRGGDPA